jgi:hypothetical protein
MRIPLRPAALLTPVLLALLPAASLARTDEIVDRVIELGTSDSRVHEHLEYMTERIGPRLSGSTACTRSCEWAVAQFRSFGLEARLERWGEFPVGFERGRSTGGMVSPVRQDFVFGTNAWTAGTPGPVRGRAVLEPVTMEELEQQRAALTGAWVVQRPGQQRARGGLRREISAALAGIETAGRIRGTGPLIVTGGRYRIAADDLPTEVQVNVEKSYYDDLLARLEAGQEVELEFDVDNRFVPGPVPLYNVVADIPGTDLADEYVIVGGHIDSWDGATGAQDNGTGVATTIEAARLLMEAGARPRRTIRFMLWTGEEQGLLGSRAYVEAHPELMDKISAVLVHDGGTNYLGGISGPEALVDQLRDACEPLVDLNPTMPFEVVQNGGLSRGGGSDHVPFVGKGVPGFFWIQRGRANYRHIHHTQHDHLETVVPEYQRHSALVVAIASYNIAMLDHMLDRTNLIDPNAGRGRGTRRRMGVNLADNTVTQVVEESMADSAGWQEGDVILAVDGVAVASTREIVDELQKGAPRKVFKMRRADKEFESVLDYTGTPSEKARERQRKQREEEEALKQAAKEAAAESKEGEPAGSGG